MAARLEGNQIFTWNAAAAPDQRRPFRHTHISGAGVGVIDPTTVVDVESGVEEQCARGGNLGSHVKDDPPIGLEAGSGVEHEQNDLVDVRRRASPADDEYVTLGINPHVRGLIEALDTRLPVDIRPKQRPGGGIAFYGEKIVVEVGDITVRIACAGDKDTACAIEIKSTRAVTLTDGIVELPEQLAVRPAQLNRAVFIYEIDAGTGHINIARAIDFHVDGEIVARHSPILAPEQRAIARGIFVHHVVGVIVALVAGDGDEHVAARVEQNFNRRVLGKRRKGGAIVNLAPLQDAAGIELERHHIRSITYCAARHVNVTSLVSHDRGAKLRYPRTAAVFNLVEQRAGRRVVSKNQDIGEIIGTGCIPTT